MDGRHIQKRGGVPEERKSPTNDKTGSESISQSNQAPPHTHPIAREVLAKQLQIRADDVPPFQGQPEGRQK